VVVLNLVSLASFFRFNLDTDFLTFFSEGNPKAEEYHQLNAKYQSGETISVLIERDGSLLDKASLLEVFHLQQEIEAIDGTAVVQGFIPPEMMAGAGVIRVDEAFIEEQYDTLKDFIENRYFLTDQFLTEDGHNGILIASLAVDADADSIIDSLKGLVEDSPLSLSLAGNEVIKDTIWGYLIMILCIIPPCAIILVLLVFRYILKSFRFTILSMIPAWFAALWTFGTIFWSGQEINLLTVLSPLFILVMGSAYGLHYTSHFLDNINTYTDRRELTIATLSMVGTPIFLATITTMAGFASLAWTEVVPMRHMGIFVTLGIGYAGFIALFFLPAVLSRLKLPTKATQARGAWLNNFILKASRRRVLVPVIFAAIFVVSAAYIPRLQVESNTLTYFKESSEIRQTFARIEKSFGSAIPLTGEIASAQGPAALLDATFANKVLETERELEGLPGIKSAFSVFDLLVGINNMATGENAYPSNPTFTRMMLSQISSQEMGSWASEDGFKMIVKTEGLNSDDIENLEKFVAGHSDTVRTITGMPLLFNEMNKLVIRSQIQSLGLALVLIFIMLWVALRRITAALAGLLPIALTICAIMGMLSITGFNLNLMTANLSAIAIGVGVDYSIHLISSIYYYRGRGMSREESVNAALSTVSRPVLANAFGLAIGLSALFFSPLRIHTQAASVMWVAMVVASMAALLLVPQFYTSRKKTKNA
ncbi:MAG: RND family transporter, partial [Dehalococcoidales bacterium]|nr:RND family transporter [Dehalococcoidales bacterium]